MSKSLSTQRKKEPPKIIKLPERYPREEEILIFGDTGEIDYVFDLFGKLEENLYSLLPSVTADAWRDAVNTSCINHLIIVLRAACIEFERFWQDDEWKPEDDREFIDRMNEPDDLRWLVSYLDSGRVKPVDGKNQRFYEPAYHAAARSLQLAMYFKQMPGDKEWIRYLVNELRYNLTRYHAASLEIAMHRENVYLHNKEVYLKQNEENIQTGRKIHKKSRERADEQITAADNKAKILAGKVYEKMAEGKYKTWSVKHIANEEKVSEATVWRALRRSIPPDKKTTINPAD